MKNIPFISKEKNYVLGKGKLALLACFLTLLLIPSIVTALTFQLTNNDYADQDPQINNKGDVVWVGGNEIFFYDGTTTTQLTSNFYADGNPQINDNGYVVWWGYDGTDNEIYLYNGVTTIQLTNNSYADQFPQIDNNGYVVWEGYDGHDYEIYLYNGITTIQLTNNAYEDRAPQINNGYVAWQGWDGSDWEIFRYNGIITTRLTNNLYDDVVPQINDKGSSVVWYGSDGSDWEIYLYNGITTKLTNNSYADAYPQINNKGHVVWQGSDGDWEIFLYYGKTTKLTNNSYPDIYPKINNNSYVVWVGNNEIFLYNGTTTTQLTNNSYADNVPQINDNANVVWMGYYDYNHVPSDSEIFLYTPPTWVKAYGGTTNDDAYSVQQTSDGGYIVVGRTTSFGETNGDAWVLKLNSDGTVAWQKTYGGTTNDRANSIQQTSDGGYIVAGYTTSFGDLNGDAWVLKLNSDGPIAWQKTYGGTTNDRANSIQQTSDGGYIVAGYTTSFGDLNGDAWVLKLNSDGTVAWQKTYSGLSLTNDEAYSVQQTSDGGYIVAGRTTSFGDLNGDAWVLKLNSDGTVAWQKTYGGSTGNDEAYFIQQTSDGGYIVAGRTLSFGAGSSDAWVLKLNSDGTVNWQKTYGGTVGDVAYSIQQTSDGGYIVAGRVYSFGAGTDDAWVLKLDANGNVGTGFPGTWQKTYGGTVGDVAASIQQTSDGGYIVAGATLSFAAGIDDGWVLKLDSNGDLDGCLIAGTSSATVGSISATVSNTSATVANTTILAVTSSATVANTSATPDIVCSSIDADGDGYTEDVDCDDTDPDIYPGATEVCNGVDDDCDSSIDEGVLFTFCRDIEGDGYGDPDDSIQAVCAPLPGYVANCTDNCPTVSNPTQTDFDGDGLGDACDDSDYDGIYDANDACPLDADNDQDDDGVCGNVDNCPYKPNPGQADSDGDGLGDPCDIPSSIENTVCTSNCPTSIADYDHDGLADGEDPCPTNQHCDTDGIIDGQDNCPTVANVDQLDTDKDGKGDACDDDKDGDGRLNAVDNCPLISNNDQLNMDCDVYVSNNPNTGGDACDSDIDGDGISNEDEIRNGTSPTDADSDNDGLSDGPSVPACYQNEGITITACCDTYPKGVQPYIVFDIYVDGTPIAQKDKWLPKPQGYPLSSTNPNNDRNCNPSYPANWCQTDHVTLVARLYNPVTSSYTSLSGVTFAITEVSNFAGMATNDTSTTGNDYSLTNPGSDSVVLNSFDYGGHVTIQATSVPNTGKITLPIDSDGDHLPDAWEEQVGFNKYNSHSLNPNPNDTDGAVDIETDATGVNPYPGDGLTNWREYRGIIYDNAPHQRLDPRKKDLFVRGDNFKNSSPPNTDTSVLDFNIGPIVGETNFKNAFENAGIVVHDVTGMPSFSGATQPPFIDILVVRNITTTSLPSNDPAVTCIQALPDGPINKVANTVRIFTWDTKGCSYIGNGDTYGGSDPNGTFTYHRHLMYYFYNRPYENITSQSPCATGGNPTCTYNADYSTLLDPFAKVEDRATENGTLDTGEDNNPKDKRFRGDHYTSGWSTVSYGSGYYYQKGYQFSLFDEDGNGLVELPIVIDSAKINKCSISGIPCTTNDNCQPNGGICNKEYTLDKVQRHTIIHEMGHAAGIRDHTSYDDCVMYNDSNNWDRVTHFSTDARRQIVIHNQ